jgi:hypothetical protein
MDNTLSSAFCSARTAPTRRMMASRDGRRSAWDRLGAAEHRFLTGGGAASVRHNEALAARIRVPAGVSRPAIALPSPLREKLCQFLRATKVKARRSLSLPLLSYSAPGGLRQDPDLAAESRLRPVPAEWGFDVRASLSMYEGRGDVEPLVGLAVWLRALGVEVRVCAPPDWAELPADSSEGRQREMGTCPTRGSTERAAPVIRSAGAVRRSTAASEVSQ